MDNLRLRRLYTRDEVAANGIELTGDSVGQFIKGFYLPMYPRYNAYDNTLNTQIVNFAPTTNKQFGDENTPSNYNYIRIYPGDGVFGWNGAYAGTYLGSDTPRLNGFNFIRTSGNTTVGGGYDTDGATNVFLPASHLLYRNGSGSGNSPDNRIEILAQKQEELLYVYVDLFDMYGTRYTMDTLYTGPTENTYDITEFKILYVAPYNIPTNGPIYYAPAE